MPRINFEWTNGRFTTDCPVMAESFARSPESFQPKMAGKVSQEVRTLLHSLLQKHASDGREAYGDAGGIRITVKHPAITLPLR